MALGWHWVLSADGQRLRLLASGYAQTCSLIVIISWILADKFKVFYWHLKNFWVETCIITDPTGFGRNRTLPALDKWWWVWEGKKLINKRWDRRIGHWEIAPAQLCLDAWRSELITVVCIILWNSIFLRAWPREHSHSQTKQITLRRLACLLSMPSPLSDDLKERIVKWYYESTAEPFLIVERDTGSRERR